QQARRDVPPFVTLPWITSHPAAPGGRAPGQTGGWLGAKYDPMVLSGDPNAPDWRVAELSLGSDVSIERLESRRALLHLVDQERRIAERSLAGTDNGFKRQAIELLTAPAAREAFDLAAEPEPVRERYGRNIHGQSVLLARRLVEHGVSL